MYDCCFTQEKNWFRFRAAAIIVEDDSQVQICV